MNRNVKNASFSLPKSPLLFVVVFVMLMFALVCGTQAQRWDLGFGIGASNYKGDVAPEVKLDNTSFGGNVNVRYNFSHAFALKANAMVFGLKGFDSNSNDVFLQARDYGFKSTNGELSMQVEYNFFDFGKDLKRQPFSPYIFAGAGVLFSSISTQGNAPSSDGSTVLPVLPFGVGLKHMLNDRLMLVWEFKTAKTFSDKLDGIIDNDSLAQLQRVPRTDSDTYYFFGVNLTYKFFSIKCPPHLQMGKRPPSKKNKGPKSRRSSKSKGRSNPF